MYSKFLKLHNQISKKRKNDFITLLEYLQDVKEGKMDIRVFESTYPIIKDRIKYYDGCLAGLEHGFFGYFVEVTNAETSTVEVSIDIPADMEFADEFKEVVASRLHSLVRLAQMEDEEVDENNILDEEDSETYSFIVKAFKTHSELGSSIAQATSGQKVNKILQRIRKRH